MGIKVKPQRTAGVIHPALISFNRSALPSFTQRRQSRESCNSRLLNSSVLIRTNDPCESFSDKYLDHKYYLERFHVQFTALKRNVLSAHGCILILASDAFLPLRFLCRIVEITGLENSWAVNMRSVSATSEIYVTVCVCVRACAGA